MEYEYKVIWSANAVSDILEDRLNEAGKIGYHVVQSENDKIILEREKEEMHPRTSEESKLIVNNYLHSLWHDKDELPQTTMFVSCIVELEADWYDGRRFLYCTYHKGSGFAGPKGWIDTAEIVKWAYMKDFLECE